jgi:spore maturation protein CgeB
MKILYSGPMGKWGTTSARHRALLALGHQVDVVDVKDHLRAAGVKGKVETHLHLGGGVAGYNEQLVVKAEETKPDLVWLDTGGHVWKDTIRRIRSTGAKVVSYNSDYLGFYTFYWRLFLASTHLYDAHITTNEFNLPLLQRHGARKVVMTHAAYDPDFHRPPELTAEERVKYESDAVVIGHHEPAYEKFLVALRRAGLRLRVWGPGWRMPVARMRLGRAIQTPSILWGPESVKAIASAKIGLGVLSKFNRNQSTGRSFEVPAIGTFFLAQRTPEHLAFYKDGTEAVFFSSAEELQEKAKYYIEHPNERNAIARAGHERCIRSGNTHLDRVRRMLEDIT